MVRGARLHVPARAYLRNLVQETALARDAHREHVVEERHAAARSLGAIMPSWSNTTGLASADDEQESRDDENIVDVDNDNSTNNNADIKESNGEDGRSDNLIIDVNKDDGLKDENGDDDNQEESLAMRALRVHHLRQRTTSLGCVHSSLLTHERARTGQPTAGSADSLLTRSSALSLRCWLVTHLRGSRGQQRPKS